MGLDVFSLVDSPKSMLTPFWGANHSTRTSGGALCTGADGPRPGAGRSAAWCEARVSCLTAGRSAPWGQTVRALGPDGPRVHRGGGRSPTAPGSRSREGSHRGGEILGDV
jgi:hypothetical protein